MNHKKDEKTGPKRDADAAYRKMFYVVFFTATVYLVIILGTTL